MLKGVLPTLPVSALRAKQEEITSMLSDSPVLLTHNGLSTGVLVEPNQWNDIIELLEKLRLDTVINQRLWEMENIPETNIPADEVEKELIKRGLLRGN